MEETLNPVDEEIVDQDTYDNDVENDDNEEEATEEITVSVKDCFRYENDINGFRRMLPYRAPSLFDGVSMTPYDNAVKEKIDSITMGYTGVAILSDAASSLSPDDFMLKVADFYEKNNLKEEGWKFSSYGILNSDNNPDNKLYSEIVLYRTLENGKKERFQFCQTENCSYVNVFGQNSENEDENTFIRFYDAMHRYKDNRLALKPGEFSADIDNPVLSLTDAEKEEIYQSKEYKDMLDKNIKSVMKSYIDADLTPVSYNELQEKVYKYCRLRTSADSSFQDTIEFDKGFNVQFDRVISLMKTRGDIKYVNSDEQSKMPLFEFNYRIRSNDIVEREDRQDMLVLHVSCIEKNKQTEEEQFIRSLDYELNKKDLHPLLQGKEDEIVRAMQERIRNDEKLNSALIKSSYNESELDKEEAKQLVQSAVEAEVDKLARTKVNQIVRVHRGKCERPLDILDSDDEMAKVRLNIKDENGDYMKGVTVTLSWSKLGLVNNTDKAQFLADLSSMYDADNTTISEFRNKITNQMYADFETLYRNEKAKFDEQQKSNAEKGLNVEEFSPAHVNFNYAREFSHYDSDSVIKSWVAEIQKNKEVRNANDNKKREAFANLYAAKQAELTAMKKIRSDRGFFGNLKMYVVHHKQWAAESKAINDKIMELSKIDGKSRAIGGTTKQVEYYHNQLSMIQTKNFISGKFIDKDKRKRVVDKSFKKDNNSNKREM